MEDNKSRNIIPYLCILRDSAKKRLLPIVFLFLAAGILYVAAMGIPRPSVTVDIDRESLSFVAGRESSGLPGLHYIKVQYAANREELDPLLDAISGRYTYVDTVHLKSNNDGGGLLTTIVLGDEENNPAESHSFSLDLLWVKGRASLWHCYLREEGTPATEPLLDYLTENGTPVNLTIE